MSPSLSFLQLVPVMHEPGCPICRIRNGCERRYLDNLLLEHVNDGETRDNIIASLGYCDKHTWELGLLDLATYKVAVKNSMIYEYLVKSTLHHLIEYRQKEESREKGINGWFLRLFRKKLPVAFEQEPFAPMIVKGCYVCQVGEQYENYYLYSLIEGFGDESNEIREAYLSSEGLCLSHFRKAFSFGNPKLSNELGFLVEATIQKMDSLGDDLTNFIYKQAWDPRRKGGLDGEHIPWVRALRFFGSNEENLLCEPWASIGLRKEPMATSK